MVANRARVGALTLVADASLRSGRTAYRPVGARFDRGRAGLLML